MDNFDAVIVGGGVGGLIVGAFLSAREKAQVLVLEQEDRVGGRLIHFQGKDIQKPEDYLRPLAKITGWLAESQPTLEEIVRKDLLEGYAFEAGWHGLLGGRQSRICHILQALGKPIEIIPYRGFAFWEEGKLFPVVGKGGFPWMPEADFREMHKIAREIYEMTPEEARSYHAISLLDWLRKRTASEKAIAFYDIMGAFLVGLNSARELSAGEYILTTRYIAHAGIHLAAGSVGTAPEPGLVQIAYRLAEVIREHGGEIRFNQKVKEIQIKNHKIQGVALAEATGINRIEAPLVICNVPLQKALSLGLIRREFLPMGLIAQIKGLIPVGGLCPMFGLNKPVIDVPGMYVTRIPLDQPEFPDGIVLGYVSHSLLVEGRAPQGKQLIEAWIGFKTQELQSLKETRKITFICEMVTRFMAANHPGFQEALEWALFPVIDFVSAAAPVPGRAWEEMPEAECLGVNGLFFVGDSVRNFAQYTDGVGYGALACLSSITGKDYLQILPDYQR